MQRLLACGLALLLAGCGGGTSPVPQFIDLTISVNEHVDGVHRLVGFTVGVDPPAAVWENTETGERLHAVVGDWLPYGEGECLLIESVAHEGWIVVRIYE
jgi:hypothetical protein